MAILTASAQGSPVEQFNQAQAEALQASAAGNYEQALQHYNTCITLMKANWSTHASLPVLMNNAAMIYGDLGRYDEEEKVLKEALAVLESNGRQSESDYALVLNNLCTIYFQRGKYEEAIRLTKNSLELLAKTLGKDTEAYATMLSNLSAFYHNTGD